MPNFKKNKNIFFKVARPRATFCFFTPFSVRRFKTLCKGGELTEANKKISGGECRGSVEDSLDRLISGRINDAVILARTPPEELSDKEIGQLDLYNVSELKFGKGVCEIKFADRLKAIEKLNEIRNQNAVDDAAQSFFDAIGEAAGSGEEQT